jgi:hypothetical protein
VIALRLDIPVDVGRDEARELAQRELLDPVYAQAEPPWWQRASTWLWERFIELLDRLGGAAGGLLWLIVLGAVIALFAFLVLRRTGGLQRRRSVGGDVFVDRTRSAAEHRAMAEVAARREDWGEAVRERFRAVVRQLEERGALDPRPGRTADEAARDGGVVFGMLRDDLAAAARTFDEVVYGDRPGSAAAYAAIRALDESLTTMSVAGA